MECGINWSGWLAAAAAVFSAAAAAWAARASSGSARTAEAANRIVLYSKRWPVYAAVLNLLSAFLAKGELGEPEENQLIDQFNADILEAKHFFGSDSGPAELVTEVRDKVLAYRAAYVNWKKFPDDQHFQKYKCLQKDLDELRKKAEKVFMPHLKVG